MGLASTAAKLLASLELDTRPFEAGARRAGAALSGMERRFGRIGGLAQTGLKNAAANLAKIGVVAGGFVALNVKAGISSLADLEDAVTSVDGAIAQVGKGWTTTGAIIAQEANRIEAASQAAFDDKAIVAGTTALIRYGKVSEENLVPAMQVMTDLAAQTGSVESASNLLAKALAAPEKAAGRLTRMGIILTEAQQDQIKAMTEAGDAAGAQALLLRALEEQTKGAAAAAKGPYRDALNILTDTIEDAQRVLGEAFLPVLQRVSKELSTAVSNPAFIEDVRQFGRTMAGAFDKLLEVGRNIPWGQIGDSLKIAGLGAKALFDAFTSLPPWVQTAVLTGWGLNKLSGGILGDIVGELGKGLIKGVLGMNAGVVNINAGVVNGGGGAPGGGAGAGGGLGAGIAAILSNPVTWAAGAVVLGIAVAEAIKSEAAKDPQLQQNLANRINQRGTTSLPGGRGGAFGPHALDGLRKPLEEIARNTSGSPDERSDKLLDIAKSTEHLVDRTEKFGNAEQRHLERIAKNTTDNPNIGKAALEQARAMRTAADRSRVAIDDVAVILQGGMKWRPAEVLQVEDRRVATALSAAARSKTEREDIPADQIKANARTAKQLDLARHAIDLVKTVIRQADEKAQHKADAQREKAEQNRAAIQAMHRGFENKAEAIRQAENTVRQTAQSGLASVRATTANIGDRIVNALYATRAVTNVSVHVSGSGSVVHNSYLNKAKNEGFGTSGQ